MPSFSLQTAGNIQPDFFSLAWLSSDPIQPFITTAPTGIALLEAVRNEANQIIDFCYRLANPMQQVLTNHPEEDLLSQPLTHLSTYIVESGMMGRLIQVVLTGQPSQFVEEYRLDGAVGHYDQVYLKSGDGVLMLVQDVTYSSLSIGERRQQEALLAAIHQAEPVGHIRSRFLALITGQTL